MNQKRTWVLLAISLCLILVGDLLAFAIQTDWGKIRVENVRFERTDGKMQAGVLYIPNTATPDRPAPGVLSVHGYTSSHEYQDRYSIEFARRGYVVLAIDEPGHGMSDPPSFVDGFGGVSAARLLTSLDNVDPTNIAFSGHSFGGIAALWAAQITPDYKSVVLISSAPGMYGFKKGDTTWPRNCCVVDGIWNEDSKLFWDEYSPFTIPDSAKLKTLFGTDKTVEIGKVYGSIADGTARALYLVPSNHDGLTVSSEAIGDAVAWLQATLQGGNGLPPADQTWPWKLIGNLVALIGMVMLIFPAGSLLMQLDFFKGLNETTPANPKPIKGGWWWLGAAIFVIIPVVTYLPIEEFVRGLGAKSNAFMSEDVVSPIMIWAFVNAIIGIILFLLWHFLLNRKTGANGESYGLAWGKMLDWPKIGKAFLLAVAISLIAYMTLSFSQWLFNVDYRLWLFAVRPVSPLRFWIFLTYLIPFFVFFMLASTVLNGELRLFKKDGAPLKLGWEMLVNVALMVGGFLIYLALQYLPLVFGGHMLDAPNEFTTLFVIMLFTVIPMLIIAALAMTYFFRKTGHVYAGAILASILVVWIATASQVISFGF